MKALAIVVYIIVVVIVDCSNISMDWDVMLADGYSSNEGTLLVRFKSAWGLLCDDGWDSVAADVACRQLGFGPSLEYSVANKYRSNLSGKRVVLDDVRCSGKERRLSECRSRPLGEHNCRVTEAAGVRCSVIGLPKAAPMQATVKWNPLGFAGVDKRTLRSLAKPSYNLQLVALNRSDVGANNESGVTGSGSIVATVDGADGGLCIDGVTLREGNVLCRELGLGFAKSVWTYPLGDITDNGSANVTRPVLIVANCRGGEKQLSKCLLYGSSLLPRSLCSDHSLTVGVTCTAELPDLVPDVRALQSSVYIASVPLYYMSCALEENCASPMAFEVRKNNPHWKYATRTLLKFSTIVGNWGTSDFLPTNSSERWTWHMCHMHYHSMPYFAAYELYQWHNGTHQIVASGHKASFCLEDNACKVGVEPRYKCSKDPLETGMQGISPGCSDNYLHDIDCQWIDITDIPFGPYRFKMMLNPEYRAAELSFDNNAVACNLVYSPSKVQVSGCRLAHSFDF